MRILISLLLITNISFAVTPIKEGQKSPESGYIFSQSEEKQVRGINEKRLKLEDLTVKQEELNRIQEEKLVLQTEQIKNLQIEVDKNKFTSTQKVIYFISGVIFMGASVYLTGKIKE